MSFHSIDTSFATTASKKNYSSIYRQYPKKHIYNIGKKDLRWFLKSESQWHMQSDTTSPSDLQPKGLKITNLKLNQTIPKNKDHIQYR